MTSTVTLTIPVSKLPVLQERVAKSAKIAERLGFPPPVLTLGERSIKKLGEVSGRNRGSYEVVEITLEGATPQIAGWSLVGAIDHLATGNIALLSPSFGRQPEDFADRQPTCDHCQTIRNRSKTLILLSTDGELKFVGSTCVKDFLGHDLPFVWDLWALEDLATEQDDYWESSPTTYATFRLLTAATAAVHYLGFVSSSTTDGRSPTKYEVWNWLTKRQTTTEQPITKEIVERATAIYEWVLAQESPTGYLYNAQTIIKAGVLDAKQYNRYIGIIASLPTAYDKALGFLAEQQARREAEAKAPKAPVPIGRHEVTGTVLRVDTKSNDWGTREVVTVLDDRGFKVWGTTPMWGLEIGDKIKFTATLEQSEGDETFGFYKRPAKAEVIAPVGG